MTVAGKGGQKSHAQRRAAKLDALMRQLDDLHPRLLVTAVTTLEDSGTTPAVKAQLLTLVDKLEDRLRSNSSSPEHAASISAEAVRAFLARQVALVPSIGDRSVAEYAAGSTPEPLRKAQALSARVDRERERANEGMKDIRAVLAQFDLAEKFLTFARHENAELRGGAEIAAVIGIRRTQLERALAYWRVRDAIAEGVDVDCPELRDAVSPRSDDVAAAGSAEAAPDVK